MRIRRLAATFTAVSLALGCASAAAQEKPQEPRQEGEPEAREPRAHQEEIERQLQDLAERRDALRNEMQELREHARVVHARAESILEVHQRQLATLEALREQFTHEREMLSQKQELSEGEQKRLAELDERIGATAVDIESARQALEARQRDLGEPDASERKGRMEELERRSREIVNELERIELRRKELTGGMPRPGPDMRRDPRRMADAPFEVRFRQPGVEERLANVERALQELRALLARHDVAPDRRRDAEREVERRRMDPRGPGPRGVVGPDGQDRPGARVLPPAVMRGPGTAAVILRGLKGPDAAETGRAIFELKESLARVKPDDSPEMRDLRQAAQHLIEVLTRPRDGDHDGERDDRRDRPQPTDAPHPPR